MPSKSHNAKKPKLAHLPAVDPAVLPGAEDKHHVSFAQHQHEQQAEAVASIAHQEELPKPHLKSDAQQHQQKPGSQK
jgi:hypothetical protein